MSEAKLLACPFCGGEASDTGKVKYSDNHEAWWNDGTRIIEAYFCNCMKCGTTNKGLCGHRTQTDAIDHWNKRAGGRQPDAPETPDESTLASATGSASEQWDMTNSVCDNTAH